MTAILVAGVAAAGFAAAGALGLARRTVSERLRLVCIAVAGGILLGLAFGDVFGESLELAPRAAVWGFVAGFALLLVVESVSRGHTHHAPGEPVVRHPLTPFLLGMAIHNAADGFALGVAAGVSDGALGALGVGIAAHQVPVGLSLAAVLLAASHDRRRAFVMMLLLALLIPVSAGVSMVMPVADNATAGALLGGAAGVLTHLGASHLLPELQSEERRWPLVAIFVLALATTTLALQTVLGG